MQHEVVIMSVIGFKHHVVVVRTDGHPSSRMESRLWKTNMLTRTHRVPQMWRAVSCSHKSKSWTFKSAKPRSFFFTWENGYACISSFFFVFLPLKATKKHQTRIRGVNACFWRCTMSSEHMSTHEAQMHRYDVDWIDVKTHCHFPPKALKPRNRWQSTHLFFCSRERKRRSSGRLAHAATQQLNGNINANNKPNCFHTGGGAMFASVNLNTCFRFPNTSTGPLWSMECLTHTHTHTPLPITTFAAHHKSLTTNSINFSGLEYL